MKLIEFALHVCTVLGILTVLFLILAGSLVAKDIVQVNREQQNGGNK